MGTLGAVTQSREPHATRGGSGPRAAGGGLADAPRIASAPGPAGLRLSGHLPREPVAFTPWSGLRRRPWALIKARPPAQCQAGWGLHLVPAGREAARVPVQSQGQAPRGRCALGEQGQVGRAVEPRRVRVCVGWAGCRRGLHGALRVPGGQVHRPPPPCCAPEAWVPTVGQAGSEGPACQRRLGFVPRQPLWLGLSCAGRGCGVGLGDHSVSDHFLLSPRRVPGGVPPCLAPLPWAMPSGLRS